MNISGSKRKQRTRDCTTQAASFITLTLNYSDIWTLVVSLSLSLPISLFILSHTSLNYLIFPSNIFHSNYGISTSLTVGYSPLQLLKSHPGSVLALPGVLVRGSTSLPTNFPLSSFMVCPNSLLSTLRIQFYTHTPSFC